MGQNILTLLVASISENEIVIQYNSNKNVEASVGRLLEAASSGASMDSRASFHAEAGIAGTLHYTMNESHIFVGVTNSKYPQRLAMQLCEELEDKYLDLEIRMKKKHMKELANKFETPESFDKITALENQVDATKGVMRNNIAGAMQNVELLPEAADSANGMKAESSRFNRTAKETRRKMFRGSTCCSIGFTIAVAVFLAVVTLGVIFISRQRRRKSPVEKLRDAVVGMFFTPEPSPEPAGLFETLFQSTSPEPTIERLKRFIQR